MTYLFFNEIFGNRSAYSRTSCASIKTAVLRPYVIVLLHNKRAREPVAETWANSLSNVTGCENTDKRDRLLIVVQWIGFSTAGRITSSFIESYSWKQILVNCNSQNDPKLKVKGGVNVFHSNDARDCNNVNTWQYLFSQLVGWAIIMLIYHI